MIEQHNASHVLVRRVILGATLLAPPAACGSNDVEYRTGDATCADCSVAAELITTLDFTNAPASPDPDLRLQQSQDGSFLVAPVYGATDVFKFGQSGEFLESQGGYGHGPGEYVNISSILVTKDSLWVFDPFQNRCAILSLDSLEFRQSHTCAGEFDDVEAMGKMLLARGSRTDFYRARLLNEQGVTHDLAPQAPDSVEMYGSLPPSISVGKEERSFWLSRVFTYVLEEWKLEGDSPVRVIRRSPPWLQDVQQDRDLPDPYILDIMYEPGAQVIWVAISVKGLAASPGALHAEVVRSGAVIEAIDESTGRLIAGAYFPGIKGPRFAPDRLMYAVVPDDDSGMSNVQVWRLRISPQDSTSSR
jgi:hypothetical protein